MPHLLAISGFFAIAGYLFRKVFASGMIFGSDIVFEFFYKRAYGFGELLKGEAPLWNPHQFCGYPFVAGIQTAIFYPLNAVFLIFSVETAFILSAFIHVILSGLAMYLYVWHLTRKSFPSFIAGLIYMMSGFLTAHIYGGHVTVICAYPWLPLIMLCLARSLRQNSWQWACIGGMFLGCQILAGYPLITLYTAIAIIFYTSGWGWMVFRKKHCLKKAVFCLYPVVIILISGILISAVQLIPTYIFSAYSVRSKAMSYEFATSCSFPPENFITFITPYFFGDMAAVRYWGRWLLWDIMPYAGVLPLCLLKELEELEEDNQSLKRKIEELRVLTGEEKDKEGGKPIEPDQRLKALLDEIEQGNASAAVYTNLGNVYAEKGRVKESLEAYRQAIKADPEYPTVYKNLSVFYRNELKNEELAIYYMEKYKMLKKELEK